MRKNVYKHSEVTSKKSRLLTELFGIKKTYYNNMPTMYTK